MEYYTPINIINIFGGFVLYTLTNFASTVLERQTLFSGNVKVEPLYYGIAWANIVLHTANYCKRVVS